MPARLSPQWASSALTRVRSGLPGGGMDDEAGRLVEHEQMLVLVDDVERHRLRRGPVGDRRRQRRATKIWPGLTRSEGSRYRRAVHAHLARLDELLERVRDSAASRAPAAGRAARRHRPAPAGDVPRRRRAVIRSSPQTGPEPCALSSSWSSSWACC